MASSLEIGPLGYEPEPAPGRQAAPEEPLHYSLLGGRSSADSPAAAAAAWLEAHQSELIECERHNGVIRMTAKACADRYRRAIEDRGHPSGRRIPLKLSLATCATCPVGAYNFRVVGRRT